jgi:uncharacterized protein (DUF2235 family)
MFSREINIKFVGVWDTVGALGVPSEFLGKFNMKLYEFHDTNLSGIVDNAYQAIAIDENRKDYDACLWNPAEKPEQAVEQRWFVGAHCDVGGGYPDRRLSDIALRWMQDRASAIGLGLNPANVTDDNCLGTPSDSYQGFLKGAYARLNPRHYRSIGGTPFGNEMIDESVDKRRAADATYAPQNSGFPR